jgi:tetratricopeptide (TPR) repeat protein
MAATGAGTAATGAGTAESGLDASAYARRGAAATARRDYEHAIADLTRACELAPAEASYFYGRGNAYRSNRQGDLALADFDQAIKLKSDDVPSLMARASLRAARGDPATEILPDLDAASHAAPKAADVRPRLGDLYRQEENLTAAIAEYSAWLDSHNRDELQRPSVLGRRCLARALAAQELVSALDDCDAALRASPHSAAFHDYRALVHLRLGHYDKSISDYDAALGAQPKNAALLYGRGVAKLRKGDSVGGQADVGAASALDSKIAEEAARYGIKP